MARAGSRWGAEGCSEETPGARRTWGGEVEAGLIPGVERSVRRESREERAGEEERVRERSRQHTAEAMSQGGRRESSSRGSVLPVPMQGGPCFPCPAPDVAAKWGWGVPEFHLKLHMEEGEGSERGLWWEQELVLKPEAGAEQVPAQRLPSPASAPQIQMPPGDTTAHVCGQNGVPRQSHKETATLCAWCLLIPQERGLRPA